jgi:hypothetical protein
LYITIYGTQLFKKYSNYFKKHHVFKTAFIPLVIIIMYITDVSVAKNKVIKAKKKLSLLNLDVLRLSARLVSMQAEVNCKISLIIKYNI